VRPFTRGDETRTQVDVVEQAVGLADQAAFQVVPVAQSLDLGSERAGEAIVGAFELVDSA
jgi:hypothetical protein